MKMKPVFQFGDRVRVIGYEDLEPHVFIVQEYRFEEYHSPYSVQKEICYLLSREGGDGTIEIEAYAEDMVLIERVAKTSPNKEGTDQVLLPHDIDGLLDALNDYRLLLELFGDEEYGEQIRQIKGRLSQTGEEGN